jgi:YVTN family beta-propeller protein
VELAQENIYRVRLSGRQNNNSSYLLSPAKAGLTAYLNHPPRVPLAKLASPWAKLCRLRCRLVEICKPKLDEPLRKRRFAGTLSILLVVVLLTAVVTAQQTQRRVDDPEDQEDLNRELWEFAKNSSYESILPYVTEAQRQSKATQTAEVELPNGWRIAPAGTQVEVGRLPYEAVPFAGKLVVLNTGYYLAEPQEISIVDPVSAQVVKTLKLGSLFPSAQVGVDGDLYISGGFDEKVFRLDKEFKVVREYAVGGYAGGLAAIDGKHLAVGYLATQNTKGDYAGGKLAILNCETGKVERAVDVGYFPYAVRYIGKRLYVTLLGEDKLLIYSAELKLLKSLAVGRTPQEMCTDDRRLYVVNTGADDLSVIDVKSNRMTSRISVGAQGSQFGAAPTSCAVQDERIFVTLAGTNSVAVLNKRNGRQLALIPTGWYPTKVLLDGARILVLNAKGIRGRRPNPGGPVPASGKKASGFVLTLLKGSVSIIFDAEIRKSAVKWTAQVKSESPIYSTREGFALPIKYVFYIIKENRTYDQVLGDLSRGNGDPKLTLFGESITPVQHQLAKEFVTLDNFFANGDVSIQGHSYTTSGYASPFLEWFASNNSAARWKGYPFGSVHATTSPEYLWDRLDEKGIDYRIYGENYFLFTRAYNLITDVFGSNGEMVKKFHDQSMAAASGTDRGIQFYNFAKPYYGEAATAEDAFRLLEKAAFANALSEYLVGDDSLAKAMKKDATIRQKFAEYLYRYPFNFRPWDLSYSDLDRVAAWKIDFESQIKRGHVAQLQYIWLPNDHTDGGNTKILDAFQFVAQNDAALGRVVEIISHSPIWKESLILVEEDDAQNGPDHVDASRTTAFAAGPYVKRGAVVSDRYDQLSMLRTIEMLLGLKSLNLGEQLAVPMFGIFTDRPNFEPFVPAPPSSRLADADRERYRQLGH